MCRLNALVAVKRAGSGHLGSTFSAMDVVAFLLFEELNTATVGWSSPDRDVYFSSKGHDVPGSLLRALRARRDSRASGCCGCAGSAGSTAIPTSAFRGSRPTRARSEWGSRRDAESRGRSGTSAVAGGSSSWSATASCRRGRTTRGCRRPRTRGSRASRSSSTATSCSRTSRPTRSSSLGELEERFRAFGWHVATCDGHSFEELRTRVSLRSGGSTIARRRSSPARSRDEGVSFMEHPAALREGGGTYRWHAGAPDDASFERAFAELVERIGERLSALGLEPLELERVASEDARPQGEPRGRARVGGRRAPTEGHGRVRRRRVRRRARPARRRARGARRPRRRSRLGLPRARLRARVSRPVRRVRDRRAGHGLDGGRPRPSRAAARRQLVRLLPRLARERADLQPGERADEGRVRPPLRRAHPGRARASRTSPSATSRSSARCPA